MKIFVTGAAGYIGSAVARALVRAGHEVTGLTHSPGKVRLIEELGAKAVVGDLKKPDSYRQTAEGCEALIHAAFEYSPQGTQADKTAVEALAAAAKSAKARRLMVYTSGVWVLGRQSGAPADERTPLNPLPIVAWRPAHEKLALEAAGGPVACAVVRPGCVYGGMGGLYGMMIQSAVEKHSIKLVGDGSNCWASVYLDDLAELYRLIVERMPQKAVYHATDDVAEPLREAAEALLDAAGGGSVESQSLDEARKALGPFAEALALDQRVSSEKAKRELGWKPAMVSPAKNAMHLLKQWKEKAGPLSVA